MKKCKSCKTEIDAKASKCPHCQADQRGWFRRHPVWTVILTLIVIGIIGSAAGGSKTSTTNNSTSNTQTNTQQTAQVAPIVVDAQTLVAAYDSNKLSAQDKYTGKTVQTTGYIANISQDVTGNYYLSLNPTNDQYYAGTTMQCYFQNKSVLTSLSKGQSVTVKGTMQDMSLGIVEMQNCSLVK
jgi:putative nucleic acid binding protein